MASWISFAAVGMLSIILATMFLRLRCRGTGTPFGPRSRKLAITLTVVTAAISTGLGVILAWLSHNVATLYFGLLGPSLLWLPGAAEKRIREGSLLPERLARLSPFRRLYDYMGDDMEAWCTTRLVAIRGRPQWTADAVSYYYAQIAGHLRDDRAQANLRGWRDSITHKTSIVSLINLDAPPVRLEAALKSHLSTSQISKYEIDDYERLAHRLIAEAENELHLFLAYIYRLGYRKLLIYPFRPGGRTRGGNSAYTAEKAPSPGQREGQAFDEPSGYEERATDTLSRREILPADVINNHYPAGRPPTTSAPDEHVRTNYGIIREMTHSMKTPLAHLEGVIEILRLSPGLADVKTANVLGEMKASIDICKVTLAVYRELTRVSDQIEPEAAESVDKALHAAHRIYARQSQKTTRLETNVPNLVPGYSNNFIFAIIFPLLENAVEASPDTSVIFIEWKEELDHIKFVIINDTEQPVDICRIGVRGQSSKPGHEGLGVMGVKHLVSEHDGASTSIDYRDNKFIFQIQLPRRRL